MRLSVWIGMSCEMWQHDDDDAYSCLNCHVSSAWLTCTLFKAPVFWDRERDKVLLTILQGHKQHTNKIIEFLSKNYFNLGV